MTEEARILVVSATTTDAEMIRELLLRDFGTVTALGNPERLVATFDRESPDILVLAFPAVQVAERYYLGLLRRSRCVREKPHRTILLCEREEVRKAYYLAREQHFDDYVVFWPLSFDPHRLQMSIHHAARAIAAAGRHGAHTGVFALRSHSLADLGAEAERREQAPASAARDHGSTAPLAAPIVLLVDDDPLQHKLIGAALAGTEFQLEAVVDAQAAFALLERAPPDVILMDFELPDMNGVEAIRRLRQSERFRDLPVLMVTGHSTREVAIGSLEVGAADFIVKPFQRESLLQKLRAVVGSA